jgi:hypothetical protein
MRRLREPSADRIRFRHLQPLGGSKRFDEKLPDLGMIRRIAPLHQAYREIRLADEQRTRVSETSKDPDLVFASDSYGLVVLTAALQYVGDLAHDHCLGTDVVQQLVDGQLIFASTAQAFRLAAVMSVAEA